MLYGHEARYNMLSDKQIEKFRALYKKHFGKEISKEAALEQGVKLVRLISAIYKPITQEEFEVIQAYRKIKGRKKPQDNEQKI